MIKLLSLRLAGGDVHEVLSHMKAKRSFSARCFSPRFFPFSPPTGGYIKKKHVRQSSETSKSPNFLAQLFFGPKKRLFLGFFERLIVSVLRFDILSIPPEPTTSYWFQLTWKNTYVYRHWMRWTLLQKILLFWNLTNFYFDLKKLKPSPSITMISFLFIFSPTVTMAALLFFG